MNRIFNIILLFIILSNCSLDNKTGIWGKNKKIKEEKKTKIKEIFKEEKASILEFNNNLEINLSSKLVQNSFINNFDNNNGRIKFNGNLKTISKLKFSKIEKFNRFEPNIIFENDNLIFFDNKGFILKFNNSSKLIWKKNFYTKADRKLNPILFFQNNKNILIVADTIAQFYAVNINTGRLLWKKYHSSPFNSQVKLYKNKFFVVDSENTIRCFSINDGSELWNVKTEKSFIKSQKKISIIIINNKVFFNNSIGDISAIDINSGNLIWQTPTQSNIVYEDSFSLKTSDLIANNSLILFSNNKNEFYSIDIKTGIINWKQKINSSLRSTLIDNLIFSITMEGFLVITESDTGNIIRKTNIFDNFDIKKRKQIKPVGFIVGTDNIYLSTNNGKLLIIDIKKGKTFSILKIANGKISRPFVLKNNLYIAKENSIIKLD